MTTSGCGEKSLRTREVRLHRPESGDAVLLRERGATAPDVADLCGNAVTRAHRRLDRGLALEGVERLGKHMSGENTRP